MSVSEIKRAIAKLPRSTRGKLIQSIMDQEIEELSEQLEDYFDLQAAHKSLLDSGKNVSLKDLKKELDAKHRRISPRRSKISS